MDQPKFFVFNRFKPEKGIPYTKMVNSFLASSHFYCLLIANSLDPDQDQQNIGPTEPFDTDRVPQRIFEKLILKSQQMITKV